MNCCQQCKLDKLASHTPGPSLSFESAGMVPGGRHARKEMLNGAQSRRSLWKVLHARWWPRLHTFPCNLTRIAGFVPVFFVVVILALAYIAAVPASLIPILSESPTLGAGLLILFHFIYLNVLANYALLVFADPGGVPDDWKAPPPTEEQRLAGNPDFAYGYLMKERAYDGGLRYCRHCRAYKPDRSHHCSACRRCILRMDHHCVFINNCVSFLNHKFFLSFITYAFLGCLFVTLVGFGQVAKIIFDPGNAPVRKANVSEAFETATVVGYILCLAFTFALMMFVLFHLWLVMKGKTTIELYEIVDPERSSRVQMYDLGAMENFRRACGNEAMCWLCPTRAHIDGDGLTYERVGDTDFDEEV